MFITKAEAQYLLNNLDTFQARFEGQTGKPVTQGAKDILLTILNDLVKPGLPVSDRTQELNPLRSTGGMYFLPSKSFR